MDLKVVGAYKYAAHPDTSVNCMAWRVNRGPVQIWARGEPFPPELLQLIHAGYLFKAWNSQFERLMWEHCLVPQLGWPKVPFRLWRCTAAKSAHANHPRKLSTAAAMLLPPGMQKDMGGAAVMRSMCKPVRKTKKNAHIEGHQWVEDVFSHAIQEAYCRQDVMVESTLDGLLPDWPEDEIKIWQCNERINDKGVPFDRELCDAADYVLNETMEEISQRISKATDGQITTGNQIQRIKQYINERGVNETCLDKHHVAALLETELDEEVKDVLLLRQFASGSAAKKYRAALDCIEADGRGRGLFMYYGASTGRFASLKVQIQNMKHGADITSKFRDTVCTYDMDYVKSTYGGTIITTLGENVRSLVCAPEGYTLVRCDSSQIEARVLHWLAGNEKMLTTFRAKEDPYIKLASKVFNKQIKKGDPERQIGKFAVLGLGFGMGADRFVAQVWEQGKIKLTKSFAQRVVNIFRDDNPLIKKFWDNLEKAARACVTTGQAVRVGRLEFRLEGAYLTVLLPSGRKLFYYKPHFIGSGRNMRFGYTSTRGIRSEWAGGLLCENCIARGTLVVTPRGAVPIEDVQLSDYVWDGGQWVSHSGVVSRGEQKVIQCFGVIMTPDHKVLTTEGMVRSEEAWKQSRAGVRSPSRGRVRWEEPKAESVFSYPVGDDGVTGSRQVFRDKVSQPEKLGIPHEGKRQRVIQPTEVFDLLNCGPKHCFTVLDSERQPLIVSNCVQAVARDTLVHYMRLAEDRGLNIIAHIHDELIILCPLSQAQYVEEQIMECFAATQPWMQGLPCAAEAKVWPRYAG